MARRSLPLVLFAFWQAVSMVNAQSQGPGFANLVSNPGFEDGTVPWLEDNWAHNDVLFERTKDSPHSGAYCMKVQMKQVLTTPYMNLVLPHLAVQPNMTVKISFWARGISNGAPLTFMVRQNAVPYREYFRAESILTDEWQEYVYTFVLPGNVDAETASLLFGLRQNGVFWLDDVSVNKLPPVDDSPVPTGNPIRNPSFEAGRDGWAATFRTRDFRTLADETGSNSSSPEGARLDILDDPHSPEGRRFLSLDVGPQCRAVLDSAYFPARYGRKVQLKFSLRAKKPATFVAGVGNGKNGSATGEMLPERATDQWQQFSLPLVLKPAVGGVYYVEFQFDESGIYQVDAVSLTETDQPAGNLYPVSFSVEPAAGAPAGNLYTQGQSANFHLCVGEAKSIDPFLYEVTIFDYLDREIRRIPVTVALKATGYGEGIFSVPTNHFGGFRLEARRAASASVPSKTGSVPDNNPLLAEQLYSVLPPLPPPGERPESYFGGHVDLTSYNLEIARKAGFRWLRLYPPMSTQWMAVEHDPGVWKFQTEDVARAKALGFRIVAGFSTTPDFAADTDPASPVKNRWSHSYPPADLNAWKEYVARTFDAFYPNVDAWEVWNEPDGGFLQVRAGKSKADVYLSLLNGARESLDATGKPYFLLAPGEANMNSDLGWQSLDRGAGGLIDAFSFHYYSLAAGGTSPSGSFIIPLLAKYAQYRNREGKPLPLWHTEGGLCSNSWLQTYRIPLSWSVSAPRGAASMVRAAMLFKSMGVRRYFDYQSATSPAGRRVHEDGTCEFIDVTGVPGPAIAAHTAMVALTEDTEAGGFEHRTVGNVPVMIAHLIGKSGSTDVYWAGELISLSKVLPPGFKGEIRDMMGNPLAPESTLDEYPVYVMTAGTKP